MWKHLIGLTALVAVFFLSTFAFAEDELHWGFKPSKNGEQVEMGATIDQLTEQYGALYKGDPSKKIIYLTFDNGYENGFTESILDTLKKEEVPATFFITGHYLTSATDLVKRMIADGHIIGNHSDKHPNMARLNETQLLEEWQNFDTKLAQLTGVKRTYYARPPEGTYNERVLKVGQNYHYRHIFWSVAFKDWDRNSTLPAKYAYDALTTQLHPGAIILMHTVARHNAEALPQFIQEAKKQGYTFASLDDLVLQYELEDVL